MCEEPQAGGKYPGELYNGQHFNSITCAALASELPPNTPLYFRPRSRAAARGSLQREREAGKTLGKKAQPHTAVQPGSGSDHGMCPTEPLHIVGVCFSSL